jgi:hypothetical protein
MSDMALGAVLGFIAGLVVRAAFLHAFKFGWTLLGPYHASEGVAAPNQVAIRTAARGLLATLTGGTVFGAVVLGFSLPAGRFVETWATFRLAWAVAFIVGALVFQFVGGRRAV